MAAIGRLTSGIAHDINNLLTVVMVMTELLLDDLPSESPQHAMAHDIRVATERATSLTDELLMFGRRQRVAARVVDLNGVVTDTSNLLRRVISQDIRFAVQLDGNPARIQADPGQIEQIILNLAINARDAMPNGGMLTFTTRNVELNDHSVRRRPEARNGPHVMLSVTDTGCGMDEATRSRIFEPYFTTKPMGKGTGLGLPMVRWIVGECGGHLAVHSQPARGTRFELYFPSVQESTASPDLDPQGPAICSGTRGSDRI